MRVTAHTSEPPGPGVLERGRLRADLTQQQLWIRCVGLGGTQTASDLDLCLLADSVPSSYDYNIIALALNERFTDMGLNHPMLYAA